MILDKKVLVVKSVLGQICLRKKGKNDPKAFKSLTTLNTTTTLITINHVYPVTKTVTVSPCGKSFLNIIFYNF